MTSDTASSPTFAARTAYIDAPVDGAEAPRSGPLPDLVHRFAAMSQQGGEAGARLPLAALHVRAGAVLLHEGSPGSVVYVVQSGSFKCVRTLEDGYEQVLSIAQAGELLGCEALHAGARRCSVVALEAASVFAVPAADLRALAMRCPALAEAVHQGLSRQLATTAEVADILSAVGADARLARFILWLAARAPASGAPPRRLRLQMSRRDIASLLGLAHETVSRSFTMLSDDGALRVHNREIEILDLQALRDRARNTRGSLAELALRRHAARAARPTAPATWWGSAVAVAA